MILTMDVGNTNIKTALFNGKELVKYWRISTSQTYTSDEYGILLTSLFTHENISTRDVEGVAISSVVPTINFTLEHMCKNYFGRTPMAGRAGWRYGSRDPPADAQPAAGYAHGRPRQRLLLLISQLLLIIREEQVCPFGKRSNSLFGR